MHEHGQEHDSKGAMYSKSHLILMALGCLIPILILIAVAYANIDASYFPFILILLCPLMMLLMHLPRMLPRKKRTEETHH